MRLLQVSWLLKHNYHIHANTALDLYYQHHYHTLCGMTFLFRYILYTQVTALVLFGFKAVMLLITALGPFWKAH